MLQDELNRVPGCNLNAMKTCGCLSVVCNGFKWLNACGVMLMRVVMKALWACHMESLIPTAMITRWIHLAQA